MTTNLVKPGRTRVLVVIIAMTLPNTGRTADPILNPDVAAGVQNAIEAENARAIVVGLYDNRSTLVSGFGQVSREDASLPDGNTVFEIGSVSKVFTSLLAEVQVAENRLQWDDTIASRLPGVQFANDDVAAIPLRALSSHTSGLPRIPDNMPMPDPLDPYAGYERSHLMSFLTTFDPGSLDREYAYSNLGAGLLGLLASDAAGLEYGGAMQRDVLVPIGMSDTGVETRDDQVDRLAQGFSSGADMPAWGGFDAMAGAGALRSTANDLLEFIRHNLEDGPLKGPLNAIREPQGSGETAFGWHIRESGDGGRVYWHNGGTGGYASFLAIRPDTGTGVVILSTSTEYNAITELGFAQIGGATTSGGPGELDQYAGTYKLTDGFFLTISVSGNQLVGQATGQGSFPLSPSAENEFVFAGADVRVVFEVGESGHAQSLTLFQGGRETPAPRTADAPVVEARTAIAVSAAELTAYPGRYQLAPEAIITVIVRGDQLYAQLTGQGAAPVFAYDRDRFFYKIVDATLEFERDVHGDVVAVVLHQGGQQRAPRIE